MDYTFFQPEIIQSRIVRPLPFCYPGNMNTLPGLAYNQIHLLIAPRPLARPWMAAFTARMALLGPVWVLDGGNCFDFHTVTRLVRQRAAARDPILERIRVARAFTCHQMAALLEQMPATPFPTLVMDLLASFADEQIPFSERLRLLEGCLRHLQRLSRHTSLLVSVAPLPASQFDEMLSRLEAQAAHVWRIEAPGEPPRPRLW
jgi:hypothetical protein